MAALLCRYSLENAYGSAKLFLDIGLNKFEDHLERTSDKRTRGLLLYLIRQCNFSMHRLSLPLETLFRLFADHRWKNVMS